MTRPSRYPVASFGPELLAVLLKGATERVEIPCPDGKTLMALQQRIHMLRGAMGREKHPEYSLAQRARTSRMWDELEGTPRNTGHPTRAAKNFRLIIQPNDVQFKELIEAAGVKVEAHMTDLLDQPAEKSTPKDPSTSPATEPPTPDLTGKDPYAQFK